MINKNMHSRMSRRFIIRRPRNFRFRYSPVTLFPCGNKKERIIREEKSNCENRSLTCKVEIGTQGDALRSGN